MNNEPKFGQQGDALDPMLDAALRSYSDVTPRPGLETRILAQVREAAANETPPRRWTSWIPLPIALAAAVIAAWLFWPVQNPQMKRPTGTAIAKPTAPQLAMPEPRKQQVARRVPAHQTAQRTQVAREQVPNANGPKLAVFPAPLPLTEQERLLLAYMRQTPPAEILAHAKPDEPPPTELNEVDVPGPATRKSMDTK